MSDVARKKPILMYQRKQKLILSALSLPPEIVQEILLRLPPKPLLICSTVSKSWNCLIKSPAFIQRHSRRRIHRVDDNGDDQLLLLQTFTYKPRDDNYKRNFSLHWDNAALGEYTKLVNPLEVHEKLLGLSTWNTCVDVVGICNGLVCIKQDYTVLIWNPCIRKYVLLTKPRHKTPSQFYAFGYDSRTNDYKILRCTGKATLGDVKTGAITCEVGIWSLATGSWKTLRHVHEDLGNIRSHHQFVFANGALHWVEMRKNEDRFILTFDMSTELFGEMSICDDLREKEHAHPKSLYHILRFRESLAVCEHHQNGEGTSLNIWLMKEYGVAESWIKLFGIRSEEHVFAPVWLRKSTGEVLVSCAFKNKSVNPLTQKVNDFKVHGYSSCNFVNSFVESLELLDKPSSISY